MFEDSNQIPSKYFLGGEQGGEGALVRFPNPLACGSDFPKSGGDPV